MLSPSLAKWVFFLSGAAALLYQIVWQRLLAFFSGSDIYSSTLVVAAFMAGLGAGHVSGGAIADRLSRRANLIVFAAAELAIGTFGLLSRPLYYDLLYQRLGPVSLPLTLVGALLFASLLWPTFFMGMSLPVLARSCTERLDRAASSIGMLYGLNTLGAAAGAFVTTWVLLPRLGLDGSLWIGALANATCAIVVLRSAGRRRVAESPDPIDVLAAPAGGAPTNEQASQPGFVVWALVYALSGFLALSLEIVWFRLLGVVAKSTAFTFGTLMAVYLAGLGAGSVAGTRYAGRVPRPATVFFAVQAAIGLTAGLLLAGFVELVAGTGWFAEYFSGYEPLDVMSNVRRLRLRDLISGVVFTTPDQSLPWEAALLYLIVPGGLVALPTFLMGFAFPLLQRVTQTDFDRLGRRVGFLLLANIAGSVAGTLLTGLLALNALGSVGTMKALMALSGVFALLALWTLAQSSSSVRPARVLRHVRAGAILVVVVATVLLIPRADVLWARLHGTNVSAIVFGEDATGVSVLRVAPDHVMVFVNGLGQSAIPYGDIHTALGMLPAFIHPGPRKIAVIGLGSGDTVYAAAGRQEIEEITSIEIIRPQLETLQRLARQHPYQGLHALLTDPRVRHVAGDGRMMLMRSAERFDIIEADALRPTSAYSGNLFSDGYFAMLRDRLRPNGIAVTWSPTVRVHNAFVREFPHVVALPGMLLGSTAAIALDRQAVVERLADSRVREHYGRAGIDVDRIVESYLVELGRFTPAFDRTALVDFNTDLFPKDELDRPAGPWYPSVSPAQ